MIEVGDLAKYKLKARYYGKEEEVIYKGVWLVVAIEINETFGELITVMQGKVQRLAHPDHLEKFHRPDKKIAGKFSQIYT